MVEEQVTAVLDARFQALSTMGRYISAKVESFFGRQDSYRI
jgi:hypothetical protein